MLLKNTGGEARPIANVPSRTQEDRHIRIHTHIHIQIQAHTNTERLKPSCKAVKTKDSCAKSRARQHKQKYTCTHTRIQKLKHNLKSRTCRLDFHVTTEPSKHSHKAAKIKDNYAKSRVRQHKQTFTCTHTRIQKLKHCLKSRTCRLDFHVNTEPSKRSHMAAKIKDNSAKSCARPQNHRTRQSKPTTAVRKHARVTKNTGPY